MSSDPWLAISDAAERAHVSHGVLRYEIAAERLPVQRLANGTLHFKASWIDAWMATRRVRLPGRKRILFAIDADLADGLRIVKQRTGVPETALIRRALRHWLHEQGLVAAAPPPRTRRPGLPKERPRPDAEVFLRELLAGGPVPAIDGLRAAKAAGIGEWSLTRARKTVGVQSQQVGHRDGKMGGGSSGIRVGMSTCLIRVQVQASEMEVDGLAEPLPAPKTRGLFLDPLDA